MKRSNAFYVFPALALLLIGTVLGMKIDSVLSDGDAFQQLKKLEKAFVVIDQRYVDDAEPEQVVEDAIEGMLKGLDPHSTYISAEQIREVREGYKGSFGGIGIWFEIVDDTAQVISPIADGPSEKAGLMGGDRIVGISDSTAVGITSGEIQRRLKGPVGSDVEMEVLRPGMKRRLDFTVTRDEIPLYSVGAAQMVDETTGYIEIDRFAMTTYDEFMEAMRQLQEQGMERLVLDLRFNPGGVMEAAVKIADEFLSGGQTIVETRGRTKQLNQKITASSGGAFEEQPVIVLVNQLSASASEILAGALQDHDRALIVGNRTFGKGLVQNQFSLPDESVMQLTVARYYTPSGRLIQTPYESGDQEDYYEQKFAGYENGILDLSKYKEQIPDSLAYETEHGRTVFGGGGILPDYVINPDTTSLVRAVRGGGFDLTFVRQWFRDHEAALRQEWGERPEAFIESYEVPEAMWTAFWDYAAEDGLTLKADAGASPEDGVYPEAEAVKNRARLETYLKVRLAQQLYGSRTAQPLALSADVEFEEALGLWDRARELAAYRAGTVEDLGDSSN